MICIPVIAKTTAEALKKMAAIAPIADMMEIRLDVMESFNLEEMLQAASIPVIVTHRSKKEGGQGPANHTIQINCLLKAIELDAAYVDEEYSLPLEVRQKIFQAGGLSRLIISAHLLNGTPSKDRLEKLFRKMAATGADIVKIITFARTPEDNLRVLGLIPPAQELGVKIITFAMGPLGRISRISTLLMGGYLTFAALEAGQESASGQIPAKDMKKILTGLGKK